MAEQRSAGAAGTAHGRGRKSRTGPTATVRPAEPVVLLCRTGRSNPARNAQRRNAEPDTRRRTPHWCRSLADGIGSLRAIRLRPRRTPATLRQCQRPSQNPIRHRQDHLDSAARESPELGCGVLLKTRYGRKFGRTIAAWYRLFVKPRWGLRNG